MTERIAGDETGKAEAHGHELCGDCGVDLKFCPVCYGREGEEREDDAIEAGLSPCGKRLCWECAVIHGSQRKRDCKPCLFATIDERDDDDDGDLTA